MHYGQIKMICRCRLICNPDRNKIQEKFFKFKLQTSDFTSNRKCIYCNWACWPIQGRPGKQGFAALWKKCLQQSFQMHKYWTHMSLFRSFGTATILLHGKHTIIIQQVKFISIFKRNMNI